MTLRRYVPDERRAKVWREQPLPRSRPPTKREVWEHYHAIFFDFKGHSTTPICTDACNHRSVGELEGYCRDAWAWGYVSAVMKGWDKHPNWTEGDPVIPSAVAKPTDFPPGNWSGCLRAVQTFAETAKQLATPEAA